MSEKKLFLKVFNENIEKYSITYMKQKYKLIDEPYPTIDQDINFYLNKINDDMSVTEHFDLLVKAIMLIAIKYKVPRITLIQDIIEKTTDSFGRSEYTRNGEYCGYHSSIEQLDMFTIPYTEDRLEYIFLTMISDTPIEEVLSLFTINELYIYGI